jgi:hypothetical protein
MNTTRREFLGAVAAVGLFPVQSLAGQPSSPPGMPPHRGILVPGVHAYADPECVRAGGILRLHASHTVPCRVEIRRPGGIHADDPDPGLVADLGESRVGPTPIFPGSYVHVARGVPARLGALAVEAWVRPASVDRLVGVATQEDKESDAGFALGIGKDGYVGFFLGNGKGPDDAVIHRTRAGAVEPGAWQHLVASWDGRTKRILVNGRLAGEWPFAERVDLGKHPLRLGAMGERGETLRILDGDLGRVTVWSRGLDADEVRARFGSAGKLPDTGGSVLGCWTLSEGRGERVTDVSGNRRHGRLINDGQWFSDEPAPGSEAPRRAWHGLRLSPDHLRDRRWPVAKTWKVPASASPGKYLARWIWNAEGRERWIDVAFAVTAR